MRHAVAVGVVTIGLVCQILVVVITTLAEWSTTPAVEFLEKRRHDRCFAVLGYCSGYRVMRVASDDGRRA